MAKLQELAIEDVGDPTIPLEHQNKTTGLSSVLTTTNDNLKRRNHDTYLKNTTKKIKVNGVCFWSGKNGHKVFDCPSKKLGDPKSYNNGNENGFKQQVNLAQNDEHF